MATSAQIQTINEIIGKLVYDKVAIKKAYNYYHAIRDVDQYKHLETNYGIGTPTAMTFTPLIKKHVDILVGEYMSLNPELKITCKDSATISNVLREKQLKISSELVNVLKQHIQNNLISAILENKEAKLDPLIEHRLNTTKLDIESSFISEYEIAAQNILEYFKQSRYLDLSNKMATLFTDLLISGTCYYRTKVTDSDSNVNVEILNPINTFIERNPNSPMLADSQKAVIKKWMSKEEILVTYKDELNKEALSILDELPSKSTMYSSGSYFIHSGPIQDISRTSNHTGLLAGVEATPGWPGSTSDIENLRSDLILVHELEWIEVNKTTKKMEKKEAIKIADQIYIMRNSPKYTIRTADSPDKCRLSVNGHFFLDRNGDPYSLMAKTMDLQDKYDLLIFYRDNLIANSGTVGNWVDIAFIPTALGGELVERLQKWLAYKKSGIGLLNSQEEGGEKMTNTIFNGFDETVKAQSIQAIQLAMQSIEQQASAMTGVLSERLAQYEQRDAVSNVQLGVKMSGLLTKQYFAVMDSMYKEINYDLLNLSKLVYTNGITGTLILGGSAKIFTALPEHYTVTDFDIHIEDSSKSIQSMENVKALNFELVKAGMSDAEMAIQIMTSNNMTELKKYIGQSMKSKKQENDVSMQLQQQLEQSQQILSQTEQQNKELSAELSKLQQQLNKSNETKLLLEKEKLDLEREKINNDKYYNEQVLETKKAQINLEGAQIYDANPYNDKIKQHV